ncbi:MAG: tRNA glutamyl-Q(34) synthetase GluQRS [Pseudomonadota bacterium]
MTTIERFAPSPNGALHLGHAFSCLIAHDAAKAAGGLFLLRIEDLDQTRTREAHVAAIERDLAWLGVDWPRPALRQSRRMTAYREALTRLALRGLLYPCTCTRRDIAEAQAAPQEGAALAGPDGPPYPGICRKGVADPSAPHALRLDMRRAVARLGGAAAVSALELEEIGAGPNGETGRRRLDPDWLIHRCGDVVLARKDAGAAYHLAVVVDDAAQHVTHVTRGEDLYEAAALHRFLQALLELPVPVWRHHRLIRDETGRRLAKRDRDAGLAELREAGVTPEAVRARLGLPPAAA